jgi:hypothetical protein
MQPRILRLRLRMTVLRDGPRNFRSRSFVAFTPHGQDPFEGTPCAHQDEEFLEEAMGIHLKENRL